MLVLCFLSLFFLRIMRHPRATLTATLFPSQTLFRSLGVCGLPDGISNPLVQAFATGSSGNRGGLMNVRDHSQHKLSRKALARLDAAFCVFVEKDRKSTRLNSSH